MDQPARPDRCNTSDKTDESGKPKEDGVEYSFDRWMADLDTRTTFFITGHSSMPSGREVYSQFDGLTKMAGLSKL